MQAVEADLITDPKHILFDALRTVQDTAHLANFAGYRINALTEVQYTITRRWAAGQAARNQQLTNTRRTFLALAKSEGFTLAFNHDEAPDMQKQVKRTVKQLRADDLEQVITLNPVTNDELRALQEAGKATEEDYLANLRAKVEALTGDIINEELAEAYAFKPRERAALRRFTDYLVNLEDLEAQDRDDAVLLPYHRQHHTANRLLLDEALLAVFGEERLASEEILTEGQLKERFADFQQTNGYKIRRLDGRGDLSSAPVAVFRRLLKRFHINLSSKQVKVKDENGEVVYDTDGKALRTMIYWLDANHLTVIRARAEKRLAMLTKNAEIPHSVYREFSPSPPDVVFTPPDLCGLPPNEEGGGPRTTGRSEF